MLQRSDVVPLQLVPRPLGRCCVYVSSSVRIDPWSCSPELKAPLPMQQCLGRTIDSKKQHWEPEEVVMKRRDLYLLTSGAS